MAKLIKKSFLLASMLIICIATLVSCGNSDKSNTRYVAAKLVDSDMWSIVDVSTGEIIHKDEFKSQPTIIVNDKFCVKMKAGCMTIFQLIMSLNL